MKVYKQKKKNKFSKKGAGGDEITGKMFVLFYFVFLTTLLACALWFLKWRGTTCQNWECFVRFLKKSTFYEENGVNILKQIVCETKK